MQIPLRLALALALAGPREPLPPGLQHALAAVSASELKGDLSFLASDALQGRFTPSPGLDIAAEFIAAKFRAAGLEPGGDQDYFQTAEVLDRRLPAMTGDLTVFAGQRRIVVPAPEIVVEGASRAVHLERVPVVVFQRRDVADLANADIKGKAVIVVEPAREGFSMEQRSAESRKARSFYRAVSEAGASVVITLVRNKRTARPDRLLFAEEAAGPATLSIHNEELVKLAGEATLSAEIPAPSDHRMTVKNVIGILRGSDAVLAKTAVLLSAHYDHIGTIDTAGELSMHAPADSSDRVYNGANDDGSGTVSVIEIARAVAGLRPRPKRSIIFMTFFGEERGELGSQFYGRHPVFPIAKTVADVNLEQVGRTDSTTGPQLNSASFTGFDYSDVVPFFERAGKRLGIRIYRDVDASDSYFTRSDNDALAEQGVPAHSMCVAFDFPDYHGLGDEWQKVDYENMARVDRMVLLGLVNLANSPKAPEWNTQNPKTVPFRAARLASARTY